MRSIQIVVIVETIVLVTTVTLAGSLYGRIRTEIDDKDKQLMEVRNELKELRLQYDDVSTMYSELKHETVLSANPTSAEGNNLTGLERELAYERKRYRELEDAFERLKNHTRFA